MEYCWIERYVHCARFPLGRLLFPNSLFFTHSRLAVNLWFIEFRIQVMLNIGILKIELRTNKWKTNKPHV